MASGPSGLRPRPNQQNAITMIIIPGRMIEERTRARAAWLRDWMDASRNKAKTITGIMTLASQKVCINSRLMEACRSHTVKASPTAISDEVLMTTRSVQRCSPQNSPHCSL